MDETLSALKDQFKVGTCGRSDCSEGVAEILIGKHEGFKITEGDRAGTEVLGYKADPEFYRFVRSMEALSKTADEGTEFIISTDNELFKYLNEKSK